MSDNYLVKLFEHNNWANQRIIQACYALTDAQLDAEPQSATKGSIRATVIHLVGSQDNYLKILTVPVETRNYIAPAFADLKQSALASGEGLLDLARGKPLTTRFQTKDGYYVEPWVIFVQAINHATEHREQISSMLTSLGITPPELDGWAYGEAAHGLVPVST